MIAVILVVLAVVVIVALATLGKSPRENWEEMKGHRRYGLK